MEAKNTPANNKFSRLTLCFTAALLLLIANETNAAINKQLIEIDRQVNHIGILLQS
jgi:hypothetical protein